MIWLTSDLHLGHEKDFLWFPRGFSSWEEHAEKVVENFNSVVADDDIVYILGDCVLKHDDYGLEKLKLLKGHKYLAIGNHDSDARIERYRQSGIFEDIQYGYRIKYKKMSFWLQHYPAMMGNYKDKIPIVCLAGHTHSPDRFQNMEHNCYNVALDAHKCFPVSIDDIIADIKEYRKTHAATEYPDRSPYCASCNNVACLARNTHTLPCEGYIPKDTIS